MCDYPTFNIELPLPKTLVKKKKNLCPLPFVMLIKKKIKKIVLKEKIFL